MTTRKLSIVVLAVAVCLVCMGCGPTIQPSEEKQKASLSEPTSGSPNLTQFKKDESSICMRLLTVKLVQKDLRLTNDQTKKLRGLYETYAAQTRQMFAKLFEAYPQLQSQSHPLSFSQEESKALDQKIKDLESVEKKFRTKSLAILIPSQAERLKQIQLQTAIPGTLKRSEIIKALHLSEEQLEKIRTLSDQMYQRQVAKRNGLRNPNQKESIIAFMKTSYKDQVEITNRILDILTPQQRTELEKWTGKMIDLTQIYSTWIDNTEFCLDDKTAPWITKRPPNPFRNENGENKKEN